MIRACPRPGAVLASLLLAACAIMAFCVRWPVPCPCSNPATGGSTSHVGSPITEYDPSQYSSGVFFRSGNPTSEGYGTFFSSTSQPSVEAMYLRKTLIIQDVRRSGHGYVVGPQVNAVHARPWMPSNYSSSVCEHKYDWDWGRGIYEKDILQLMCLQLSNKSFKDPADMLNVVGNDSIHTRATSAALALWTAEFAGCLKSMHMAIMAGKKRITIACSRGCPIPCGACLQTGVSHPISRTMAV